LGIPKEPIKLCKYAPTRQFAFFFPKSAKINIRKETIIMKLQVGQKAPDFKLPSHLDQDIRLSDYRGKNVVLAFFPLAWTPI
jgi:hypothetical protein